MSAELPPIVRDYARAFAEREQAHQLAADAQRRLSRLTPLVHAWLAEHHQANVTMLGGERYQLALDAAGVIIVIPTSLLEEAS